MHHWMEEEIVKVVMKAEIDLLAVEMKTGRRKRREENHFSVKMNLKMKGEFHLKEGCR